MSGCHEDQTILSRLVGCWQGTLLHRAAADQPSTVNDLTGKNT